MVAIHTLTWTDGTRTIVEICAAGPNDEAPLVIRGNRRRVAGLPATSRPSLLQLELRELAAATGAMLATASRGIYEAEDDLR